MTFDYFIQVSKVILKYKEQINADELEASVAERRELLKAEKYEEFNKLAIELSNWETQVTSNIEARLYSTLKVQKTVVEKYLMDFEKRTQYEIEIEETRVTKRAPVELTKAQCLDALTHMEKAKFDVQVRMYDFVRLQKDNPTLINAKVRVEELKQADLLFIKTGIEEADVEPSIERLKLREDEEYVAVCTDWAKKSQAFLTLKAKENVRNHSAAEAQRARQRVELQQNQLEQRKAASAIKNKEAVEALKILKIGDKLTHISFIKQGKASYVLPNYQNTEYVSISEGDHLGLMDVAFRILDEQQKIKAQNQQGLLEDEDDMNNFNVLS